MILYFKKPQCFVRKAKHFLLYSLISQPLQKQSVIIAYYDKNMQKLQKTFLKLTKKDVKAMAIWIVPVFFMNIKHSSVLVSQTHFLN